MSLDDRRRLEAPLPSDLAPALRDLAEEIRAVRDALGARGGIAPGADREQLVHDLAEGLEEAEADNQRLRAENERLLVAQAQLAETLATLAGRHERAQADAERAHALLRSIDGSRAWRLLCGYWRWVARLRGRVPARAD